MDRPDGPIGWTDVLGMTLGDALDHRPRLRRKLILASFPWMVPGIAALCFLAAGFADRLLTWELPRTFGSPPGTEKDLSEAVANVSANLTAYLALLAATVSIGFTYHQLRAKVRADNRQAWIDRARRLLADIADEAGSPDGGARSERPLGARRLELELMLNPSEKDHRMLIHLLQTLSVPGRMSKIPGAALLREEIMRDDELLTRPDQTRLTSVLDEKDRDRLISYAVRLGHVVLKREWERVKNTR